MYLHSTIFKLKLNPSIKTSLDFIYLHSTIFKLKLDLEQVSQFRLLIHLHSTIFKLKHNGLVSITIHKCIYILLYLN